MYAATTCPALAESILDCSPAVVLEPPFGYKASPFPEDWLVRKTHVLRGQFVVLENDLAELYGVTPAQLGEQANRRTARFSDDCLFTLLANEVELLPAAVRRTLSASPRAFTAPGVLMLACILGSEQAIATSLRIMELFVRMRRLLINYQDLPLRLECFNQRTTGSTEDSASTLHDYLFAHPARGIDGRSSPIHLNLECCDLELKP